MLGCKRSTKAKLDFSDGSYEGEINGDGQKHGRGIYRWIDGSVYEGDYRDDLRDGKGKFLWSNGESYTGDYLKDGRTGKGIYHWPDGSKYNGEFLSGKRQGLGTYHSTEGSIYEGEWFDDLQRGQGMIISASGKKTKGIWRKGNLVSKPAPLPPSAEKPVLPKIILAEEKTVQPKQTSPKEIEDFSSNSTNGAPILPTPVSSSIVNHTPSEEIVAEKPAKDTPKVQLSTTVTAPPEKAVEPIENKPEPAEEHSTEVTPNLTEPDWTGTVAEAEAYFITEMIDGVDTVRLRSNGTAFSGRMRIVNLNGQAKGEVNLLKGRMHGEEIFYDESGNVVERNFWADGYPIGQ